MPDRRCKSVRSGGGSGVYFRRNEMKRSKCIFSALLLLLAACGSMTGCSDHTEQIAAADDSGTLVIGSGQAAATMNPVNAYDGWYAVRYGIGQTLTRLDEDMSVSAWLVEDYASNEDDTVWTFTIREGVTFSNGTALTAELAKASLENVFENSERGTAYFTPASITADGQTLVITLQDADPILPNKLADPLFTIIDTTVPYDHIEESGAVCTGPFRLESFDAATKECVVVKNENYWGGDVMLDRIDFVYTEDQSTITMALQKGEFDAVYNVSMTDIDLFAQDDRFEILSNAGGRTTIGFMNQNGLLGDLTLRQAILQNLDKETYCAALLNGQYIPGVTLLTSAVDYGYDTLIDPNAYDSEHAVQLLEDAGYIDRDGDGFRETPEGEKLDLRLVYYSGRPEQQILAEAVQVSMAAAGIRMTIEVHDTQTVMNMQKSGDYDLLCMSINMMNCGDPENQMNTYFGGDGACNASGYDSAEFNALMKQVHAAADPVQRKELVKQAEQVLLDDAAAIYFCYPIMNFVMQSNVSNLYCTAADFYWVDEHTNIS